MTSGSASTRLAGAVEVARFGERVEVTIAMSVDRLRHPEQQVEQRNIRAAAARRIVQQRRVLQLGQVSIQRTVCFRAHD